MNEDPVRYEVDAGVAAGAGTSIALAGDIILAGEPATFLQTHARSFEGR
jgi:1,4-dihydroxy-2-naphthoyl-CoA synthase